jgi:uncharacterized protein (DUF2147 family)
LTQYPKFLLVFLKLVATVVAFSGMFLLTHAQDKFCKTWYTHERVSKIQIFLAADGKYYGKIVWLRDSTANGKPLLDKQNPDASKGNQPWLGLQIISGLQKKSENELVGGKIYDPTKGNYYSCKVTVLDNGTLDLHGYILGMPFLGRSTIWYPVNEERKPVIQQKAAPPPANTSDKKSVNP